MLHTINSDWSNVYIEGAHAILCLIMLFGTLYLSVLIEVVIANSADPGEVPHSAIFHLCLYCLPIYPFRGFRS